MRDAVLLIDRVHPRPLDPGIHAAGDGPLDFPRSETDPLALGDQCFRGLGFVEHAGGNKLSQREARPIELIVALAFLSARQPFELPARAAVP